MNDADKWKGEEIEKEARMMNTGSWRKFKISILKVAWENIRRVNKSE